MGFYEDDRIRNKNKLQNEAYNEYLRLSSQGLSDEAIKNMCLSHDGTSPRNDIYLAILKIVRR